MHISTDRLDKALATGMGDLSLVEQRDLTNSEIQWIRDNVPVAELAEYLIAKSFASSYQFCCHNIYDVTTMIEENSRSDYGSILNTHFILGAAPNGDLIAISKDCNNQKIGFIGHEDPDEMKFIGLEECIDDFFWKPWEDEDYPCDYYDAEDWVEQR